MSLTTDETNVDGCVYIALNVLFHKQLQRGCHLYPGNNFGEMCLLSQTGLRVDSALTVTNCEVYYVVKEDLAEVFRFIEPKNKQQFLFELASSCTISGSNGKECRPVVSSSEVDDVELSWNGRDAALEELLHGYAAIVESISSALEGKVVDIDNFASPKGSTTNVTTATEQSTLSQVQAVLAIAAISKRSLSLDDAMVVNRKMRHSFSVESILNRKRIHDGNESSDEDDESSIVTSRRSDPVFSDEEGRKVTSQQGCAYDCDDVRPFDELESFPGFIGNTPKSMMETSERNAPPRRYTIGVIGSYLLVDDRENHHIPSASFGSQKASDIAWLQLLPSNMTHPKRRGSF